MFKKIRVPALALAAAMAVAVPTLTLAADRDDHHRRDFHRREVYRDHGREFRDRDRYGFYDRFGVWHR